MIGISLFRWFFFFKQKTAYDMRISDWSSDVCSSDLLGLDRLGIGDRVDLAFDVGDVAILEAAQYMTDRIDLADMGEELVAEALTLRGTAHQAGDIDDGQQSGRASCRERVCQFV